VNGFRRLTLSIAWWSAACFLVMLQTAVVWADDEPPAPLATDQGVQTPDADGETAGPEAVEPRSAEPPAEVTFDVKSYRVEGNTLLDSAQLDVTLVPFTGANKHVADVDRARAALEAVYRDAGYPTVLIAVPEQTLEDGVVRLQVMEATLGEVTVSGNRHISTQRLRDKLPSINPGAILHEPTILAELEAVNATPDRRVAPVLTMGQEPGTVNLELRVKDRLPLHGDVEWNNRGTPSTPDQRLSASVRYADMFAREQTLALQTTQTPQDWGSVAIYSASYVAPLGNGRSVSGYMATSSSESALDASAIESIGGDVSISGNSMIGGIRYTTEPRPMRQLSVGLDYKHLKKSEALFPDDPTTAAYDPGFRVATSPVSYAPVSLAYSRRIPQDDGVTTWSLSIKGNKAGLVPGGGSKEFGGDPNDSINVPGNRRGATGTFIVLQASARRVQQLDDGSTLSASIAGQAGTERLIAAEQFFAGGVDSVRGYIENEAQGDHGVQASVEVATPPMALTPARWLRGAMQGAVFIDGAALWVQDALPGEVAFRTLAGAGAGLRLTLANGLTAKVDQAWTFREGPITGRGETRGYFSVAVAF
jgi:hemolysin activation/secretion protein